MLLLAQVGAGGWGIAQWCIALIIIIAVVAILFIFIRVSGVNIPQWVWQVIGIVIAAIVCIVAIRFLLTM